MVPAVEGIVKAFPNYPFFILITSTTTEKPSFDKYEVLEHLKEDIYTIVIIEARQQVSEDEPVLSSVTGTVGTEEESFRSTF